MQEDFKLRKELFDAIYGKKPNVNEWHDWKFYIWPKVEKIIGETIDSYMFA